MAASINREISATWRYHDATKHSYRSVRAHVGGLDWANQPRPFKIYPTLEPLPLAREFLSTGAGALDRGPAIDASAPSAVSIEQLAALLHFSAGVTRRRSYPGGEYFFRAAACTGALYEIELYLVAGELTGLPAGIFHFSPADFALRRLRKGDWRGVLVAATAAEPAVAAASVSLVSTGVYWRNAWKYGPRTYRHFGWDNGTILANLLAMAGAQVIPSRLVLGFDDRLVNRLLGLQEEKEVALAIVALGAGQAPGPAPPPVRETPPLSLDVVPYSKREVDYPEMRAMHEATELSDVREVASWRGGLPPAPSAEMGGATIALESSGDAVGGPPLEAVIARRGSTRQFDHRPISLRELATALHRATAGIPADFRDPPDSPLNDIYIIANAVEGLEAGSYLFHCHSSRLERLKGGSFRREATHLALDQALAGDAAANIYLLADLERVLGRFGNRGYRAAQLEAGIIGGRLYLAAYAQGFGATGLTFYDDEVTGFFSPHAAGKSVMFLVALGHSARRLPLASG